MDDDYSDSDKVSGNEDSPEDDDVAVDHDSSSTEEPGKYGELLSFHRCFRALLAILDLGAAGVEDTAEAEIRSQFEHGMGHDSGDVSVEQEINSGFCNTERDDRNPGDLYEHLPASDDNFHDGACIMSLRLHPSDYICSPILLPLRRSRYILPPSNLEYHHLCAAHTHLSIICVLAVRFVLVWLSFLRRRMCCI